MKFETKCEPGKTQEDFRTAWEEHTKAENSKFGVDELSMAQQLMIDMFTGNDKPWRQSEIFPDLDERVVGNLLPAQVELEALFRGRGAAMALMFHREGHDG